MYTHCISVILVFEHVAWKMNAQNPSTSLQIEGRQGMKGKWDSDREINEPPAKSDNASYDMEDGCRRQEVWKSLIFVANVSTETKRGKEIRPYSLTMHLA